MKKFFAIVTICLIACLSITGFITTDEVTFAADDIDFSTIEAIRPEEVDSQAKHYWRIDGKKPVDIVENLSKNEVAIRQWKWVCQNVDKINTGDVVLIEHDIDFIGYKNLTSLGYENVSGMDATLNQPIEFSVMGGKYKDGKVNDKKVATISNFNLKFSAKNRGFINSLNNPNAVIKNLHFVDCAFTSQNRTTEAVGGLIGTLYNGTISQVSFGGYVKDEKGNTKDTAVTMTDINTTESIGGIVGKVVNGVISNCDFHGSITTTNSNAVVGGIVGEIIMGDQILSNVNQKNNVKIVNAYFIGSYIAGTNGAGIIGNIGFNPYKYDKAQPLATIDVNQVYAKVTNAEMLRGKAEPNGILGGLYSTEFKPNADNVIVELSGIKFSQVISSAYSMVKGEAGTATPTALAQFPKNMIETQISDNNVIGKIVDPTTIDHEFHIAQLYMGFNLNAWIMPEDIDNSIKYLDLKYKFKNNEIVTKVSAGTSSTIVELNKNTDKVSFIDGGNIVMSIVEQDGVHLNKIFAVNKEGNEKLLLYDATAISYNINNYFASFPESNGQFWFDAKNVKFFIYPQKSTTVEYKVTGTVTESNEPARENTTQTYTLGETCDGFTLYFDFTSDGKKLSRNEYSANVNFFNGLIDNNFNAITDVVIQGKESKAVQSVAHDEVLVVQIPKTVLENFRLDTVIVESLSGDEVLSKNSDKGWIEVKDSVATIKGQEVNCKTYEVRFNHFTNKLYNKEDLTIKFLFRGIMVKPRISDAQNIVLDENGFINVDYLKLDALSNPISTKQALLGDSVQIRFSLTQKAINNRYVLNLLKNGKFYISYAYGKDDTPVDVECTYDEVKGEFTTVNTDKIEIKKDMRITINMVQQRKVHIKYDINTYYGQPDYTINNIPVIEKNNVVSFNGTATRQTLENNVYYVFTSIEGVDHDVELADTTNYQLKDYKVGNQIKTFKGGTDKKGTLALSTIEGDKAGLQEINIILNVNIKNYTITVIPAIQNPTGEYVDRTDLKHDEKRAYGTEIKLNEFDYYTTIYDFDNDYKFVGWQLDGSQDVISSDILKLNNLTQDITVRLLVDAYHKFTVVNTNNVYLELANVELTQETTPIAFVKSDFAYRSFEFVIKTGIYKNAVVTTTLDSSLYTLYRDEHDPTIYRLKLDVDNLPASTTEIGGIIQVADAINIEIATEQRIVDVTVNDDVKLYYDDIQEVKKVGNVYKVNYGSPIIVKSPIKAGMDITWDGSDVVKNAVKNDTTEGINKYSEFTLERVTENLTISATYTNSPTNVVNHEFKDKVVMEDGSSAIELSTNVVYSFFDKDGKTVLGTTKNKILSGTKVRLAYDKLDPIYEIVGWKYKKAGDSDFTVVNENRPLEIVADADYEVQLVVRKTEINHTVTITVPYKDITVSVYTDLKVNPVTEFTSTGADEVFTYEVLGGTVVTVVFDGTKNPNYQFAQWNITGKGIKEIAMYEIGKINDDYQIELDVTPKPPVIVVPDPFNITYGTKHGVIGGQSGTITAAFTNNNTQVVLSAVPSKHARFVKWYKNGAEFSTDAKITVDNILNANSGKDKYEAEYALCEYNVNIADSNGLVTVSGQLENNTYGNNVRVSLGVKEGYTIDKVVINGKKEIVLGSVKEFTIYNIDDDQNVQVIYRKVGMTADDKELVKAAEIMLIVTVLFAIVVKMITMKIIKKTGTGKKHRKIKINVD